ncbi:MAG TPA: phosphotransferase [Thermomicrobiales bacterium]|nr:phosphotransferase [Thermomicrobiales bacterium]
MADSPAWQTHITATLVHPTEPSVWLRGGATPALQFQHDGFVWYPDVAPVIDAMRDQWGVDAVVLRCVDMNVDRERRHRWHAYLMQPLSPDLPPDGCWAPIAALAPASLPDAPGRETLLAALRDIDAPAPPIRRPWTARGWFEAAVAWSGAALHAAGVTQHGPPRQYRTWGLSTIIRFETSSGTVYFKASVFTGAGNASGTFLFANEAALLGALVERIPAHLPVPLAVDTERVWLLLPDAGVQLVNRPDLDLWETALRLHARHQRSWVGQTAALFRAGCLDRRLPRLAAQVEAALTDDAMLRYVKQPEQDRIRAAIPTVHSYIAELATLDIPDTLIHGDLHIENVALRADRPTYFDWTDAAVAHPFLDLVTFIDESDYLDGIPGSRDRLVAAYLDEWRGAAPEESLQRAAALILPLGMLHQVVSYQHILPGLEEPGYEALARGAAYWLERLLDYLPATPPPSPPLPVLGEGAGG